MSRNSRDNIYYQKRFHIKLAKDDMTKDEIYPEFSGGGGGDYLLVFSDDDDPVYSADDSPVYSLM